MALTINDLTAPFGDVDQTTLLEDWVWLIGSTKVPILLAAAGDAFLQDAGDDSIWLLDVAAGEMSRVANSVDEFRALLGDREFVISHLTVQLVADLRAAGVVLEPGEIYSYKTPPVLGGEYSIENVEKASLEVHFSLMGQIHQQVASLPPGTSITDVEIT